MSEHTTTATSCGLCGERNDETSMPVGKHRVLFHEACCKRADMTLHIARERNRASRLRHLSSRDRNQEEYDRG